ncbi:MAG: 50S ribosomal protein L10, partial [Nanoarchaeota archaeon]|nr:50S ribosomal protein L10 [Nanoarchaeota archaeon]
MAHVAEYKKKTVNEFVNLINSYPVIGVVDMENLPTAQLQKMREQLRDKVVIRMTKRRFMNIALDKVKDSKKGIEEMKNYLTGMPALLFTKDDPFKLAKTLKKSMSTAPAKQGQVAPKDIIVTAGPTPFSPGPVISELASAGMKTAIENGKIVVKSDTVVVKKGEKVGQAIAGILTRLGVEPMEVGLNLTAVCDNGTIFTRDVLDIDEEEFMGKIKTAYNSALGLALELSFLTKETTEIMIAKAFREAKTIALSQNIMADAIKEEIMAKANKEMLALKSKLNIPDAQKEKSKEEEKEVEELKEKPKEEEKEVVKEEKEKIKKEAEEKPEEEKKEVKEAEKVEEIKEPEEKPKQEKSEDKKGEGKEKVKKEEQKAEVKAEDIKEETKADEVKETPKEEKVPSAAKLAEKVE